MKKSSFYIPVAIGLIPFIYLSIVWNSMPVKVPIHFDEQGLANNYGSKTDLAGILFFMFIISIGVILLLNNLNKIDPKKSYTSISPMLNKIAITISVFLSLISGYIIYTAVNYTGTSATSPKLIMILVALLFVALGNFMNNIKPNYFVGIRTPWNLEDGDNWRKTHHLGSKIWFFGGLLMLALILILPEKFSHYILIACLVPMCAIPFGYSYSIFKNKKHSEPV
jgi:uncharacterized membrane protein